MSIRKHRDAVHAALAERIPGSVFKSYTAAGNSGRYAVVFIALSKRERSRYVAGQTRKVFTVTVHSVGLDEDLCLWVQDRVDELTGQVLEVEGRSLWPVEYVTGQAPDLDDDAPPPLWVAVSQFDITSDPA